LPAAHLTYAQAARVAEGLCGCGCGRAPEGGRLYFERACHKRANRERARQPDYRDPERPIRAEHRRQALGLRAKAQEAENKARGYFARARDLRRAADQLDRLAAGQVALFPPPSPEVPDA